MLEYILRLFILVPMVGGLAWGSLWLWRKAQAGLPSAGAQQRPARVIDVVSLGTSGKLVVLEFGGRKLLVSASRGQIALLAEHFGDD
jgi:flagellar protein FliO/FliZ